MRCRDPAPASNLRYFKEVQSGAEGSEDIYEVNIEADVPPARDLPFARLLTFNGAYRYAKYDATGNGGVDANFSASTWKLGLEWTVVDGLRIRATRSREFRAPTLWDLYQAQIISASGVTDPLTNVAAQLNTVTGGNPGLRPEIAKNTHGRRGDDAALPAGLQPVGRLLRCEDRQCDRLGERAQSDHPGSLPRLGRLIALLRARRPADLL